MHEQTMEFSVQHDKEAELKKTLTIIYDALKEKGCTFHRNRAKSAHFLF